MRAMAWRRASFHHDRIHEHYVPVAGRAEIHVKEPVLMVWDFYDGVRSGIALHEARPYYFECEFDEDEGEYSDIFGLWPVDEALLALATEQWKIFRDWQDRFHRENPPSETHPGYRGQDTRYDEIEDRIDDFLRSRGLTAYRMTAVFEPRMEQPEVPRGVIKQLDVTWQAVA